MATFSPAPRAPERLTVSRTPRRAAEQGSLLDLYRLFGVAGPEAAEQADLPVPMRLLRSGETLFHEGAAPEFVYFVRSGTFKTFQTELDGYEQVLGFVGRREVLGFDAVAMATHPSAAVSLEDSSVYALALRDLYALGELAPRFERVVYAAVCTALNRQAELAGVMSAAASEVRLARFLLTVSQRMAGLGESGRRLRLRMSRRDIASHLGVAHETISRCFQSLADGRLLLVKDREVEILDLNALALFAQGTRRHAGLPNRNYPAPAARAALGQLAAPLPNGNAAWQPARLT